MILRASAVPRLPKPGGNEPVRVHAAHLSSLLSTVATVCVRQWVPARILTPMIFLFITIVLLVVLAYLVPFEPGMYTTRVWLLLHFVIPVAAVYHVWMKRDQMPYFRSNVLLCDLFRRGRYICDQAVLESDPRTRDWR